jgi:hypothetical protein
VSRRTMFKMQRDSQKAHDGRYRSEVDADQRTSAATATPATAAAAAATAISVNGTKPSEAPAAVSGEVDPRQIFAHHLIPGEPRRDFSEHFPPSEEFIIPVAATATAAATPITKKVGEDNDNGDKKS